MSSPGRQFVKYAQNIAREVRDIPTAMGNFNRSLLPQNWSENRRSGIAGQHPSPGDWVNRTNEVKGNTATNPKYDTKPFARTRNYAGQLGDVARAVFTGKEGSPSKQYTSANPGILASGTLSPEEKRTDK